MNPSTALVLHEFHEAKVSFRRADGWVNATEMAKKFGKIPNEFLRLASTKAFISALEEKVMRENPALPVIVHEAVKGQPADRRRLGTWLHPFLGVEFARWLSPEFAVWTNQIILEILTERRLQLYLNPPQSRDLAKAEDIRRISRALNRAIWLIDYRNETCTMRPKTVTGTAMQYGNLLRKKCLLKISLEEMTTVLESMPSTQSFINRFGRRTAVWTLQRPANLDLEPPDPP